MFAQLSMWGQVMAATRALVFGIIVFAASGSASLAGPCTDAIGKLQVRIDAELETKAAAGPVAREGVSAGMSDQPTPRSMAAAEERLGEVSPETVTSVRQAMLRARAADDAGDKIACEQALADAQRLIGR